MPLANLPDICYTDKNMLTGKSEVTAVLVSVCMLVYQQRDLVSQAIDSVLCQQTDFEYEIIIGDDCSTDGTAEVLQRYARMHPDRIRLLRQPINVGPVRNAFDVLRLARGEYLAFLEGDDFWISPSKLQNQVDYLRSHPECALVYHACQVIDSDGNAVRILRQKKPISTLDDLYPSGHIHMATSTMVGRHIFAEGSPYYDLFGYTYFVGDIILKAAYLKEGTIAYLDVVHSCYRKVTSGGANYSSQDKNLQRLDAVRAYRAVRHLYGHANARGATDFQMRVLRDVFQDYRHRKKRLQCLKVFFTQMTPYEQKEYIRQWLLQKQEKP